MKRFSTDDVVSLMIEKDTETAERCGACGMFQVIRVTETLEDGREIDITENIDQGKFYSSNDDVARDLGLDPEKIELEE